VREIKELEENRTLILLKKDIAESIDGDVGPSTLLMSKVSNLSEDLVDDLEDEVDLEDQLDQPNVDPILKKRVSERCMMCRRFAGVLERNLKSILTCKV
jgi:hypothetical protein